MVGRSGCEVGQGVDEVDAAGELISVICTSIFECCEASADFWSSNAGKEALRSRDFSLPSHFATR